MVHACFDVMFHLQVLYPDGQSHVIHPKPGDFRKPGPHRHRLITQVYLSHTAWTGEFNTHTHTLGVLKKVVKIESLFFFFSEPSQIEVRLLLAYSSSSFSSLSSLAVNQWSESMDSVPPSEAAVEGTIELSKAVKVFIMPKPARR